MRYFTLLCKQSPVPLWGAILAILMLLGSDRARTEMTNDFGTWFNLSLSGGLGAIAPELRRIKYFIADRQSNMADSTRLSQNLVLTGLGYAPTPELTFMAGWGHMYTNAPYYTGAGGLEENRIWEQIQWSRNYGTYTLSTRTRLEQRFIEGIANTPWRIRELVQLRLPLGIDPKLSLISNNEIFWNLNPVGNGDHYGINGFAQNRFFVGLGYQFSANIYTDLGYLNQFIRGADGRAAYMGHAVNTSLFLTF